MFSMRIIKNNAIYLNKLLCVLLAAAVIAQAFAGCKPKKDGEDASLTTPKPAETEVPAETEPPVTPEPTPGPTQTPDPSPFADVVLSREVRLNYFAIPQVILDLMTPADIELYKRVVVACVAGETSVEIPKDLGEYPNLWRVVDMYCPLFFYNVRDDSITETEDTITWKYTNAEHNDELFERFENNVLSRLSSVREGDSELAKIIAVYKDYTASIEYDDTHEGSLYKYRHGVDALRYGRGVCWCFARGFNFLICQLGVESLTVHGLREWDGAIHEWVVFRDGDQWRYCDPTWDIGGYALNYFGFTIKTRNNDGFPEEHVTVLEGTKYLASDYFNVSDTFFKPLYTGQCCGSGYEIDHEGNRILFYDYYDNTLAMVFDLSTGEYYDVNE